MNLFQHKNATRGDKWAAGIYTTSALGLVGTFAYQTNFRDKHRDIFTEINLLDIRENVIYYGLTYTKLAEGIAEHYNNISNARTSKDQEH